MSFLRFAAFAMSVALTVVLTVGCAKTDAQKSEDTKNTTNQAIAELQSTVREAIQMGAPSSSWPDEKLDRFEALLNSCGSYIVRIKALDGKDGTYLMGRSSLDQMERAIEVDKRTLARVRAEKVKLAEKTSPEARVSDVNKALTINAELVDQGTPEGSWSYEQLDAFEAAIDKCGAAVDELSALGETEKAKYLPPDFAESSSKLRQRLDEKRDLLLKARRDRRIKDGLQISSVKSSLNSSYGRGA